MKGGARKGAGRKALPPELKKQPLTIRLQPAMIVWLKAQDKSCSVIVGNALAQQQKEEK